tara:strand:- start:24235 stop:24789 length:555 start_codon:yes stop_codon:yes gene_type:complete
MVIFTVIAALVLIYFINMYSGKKSITLSGMTSNGLGGPDHPGSSPPTTQMVGASGVQSNVAAPADPLGQNSGPARINGINTEMQGLPKNCTQQSIVDPKSLLPTDNHNEFSKMNPGGAGDIANVSLLKAGFHIGINTVGQSLRNANLQIRSEPANPQLETGPWNGSTIGPDHNRRALEIGCGSN